MSVHFRLIANIIHIRILVLTFFDDSGIINMEMKYFQSIVLELLDG